MASRLQTKLLEECKKLPGVMAIKMNNMNGSLPRGIPDVMILVRGRALFAEIKEKGDRIRPDQEKKIAELTECGCPVWVVKSDDAINSILSAIKSIQE